MPQHAFAVLLGCLFAFTGNGLVDPFWSSYLPILPGLFLLLPRYRFITLFCAAFLWSTSQFQQHLSLRLAPAQDNRVSLIQGVIVDIPEYDQQRSRFYFEPTMIEAYAGDLPRLIRLNWYHPALRPRAGESWQFEARLRQPAGLLNPGGFDYQRWQFVKGIQAGGYVRNSAANQRLQSAPVWSIHRWRDSLAAAIDAYCASCKQRGLIKALGLGFRGDIPRAQNSLLRDSGTAHLLAISGLHVGMVSLLFFALGSLCWRVGLYRSGVNRLEFASLLAIIAALAYSAMAGFSLPTLRALLMLAMLFAALCLRQRINLLQSISLSLMIILLLDPLAVGSASFWLSFSALLVIAFAQFRLPPRLRWWQQLLALQACFTLLFLPLGMLVFGQANPATFLANIVAIPLISFVVLPLTLVAMMMAAAQLALAQWLFTLVDWLLSALIAYLELLLQGGLASMSSAMLPAGLLLLSILAILLLLMPRGMPGKSLALLLLALPIAWPLPRPGHGEYRVTVFDVGMGTSLILQTRHHSLIYDFGPGNKRGYSAADWALKPFMRQQAIEASDLIVVSHADQDHSGGFQSFVDDYQPARLLSGTPDEFAKRFNLGHRVQSCHGFADWRWDGVRFRFLSTAIKAGDSSNNRSCVLMVEAQHRLLVSGDIEAAQEAKLLVEFGDELVADVLLVPHHGSATSSSVAFVNRVRPQHVIYTLSAANRWGFPRAEVESRYRAISSQQYRNDRDAAILLHSNRDGLSLQPLRKARQRIWRR